MALSPFVFLRGSCHLFYEDLPRVPEFDDPPGAWICGDLHLENVGSYLGDNGLAYFDINDFDEGLRAPVTWDLARLVVSWWLAAEQLGADETTVLDLEESLLDAYVAALATGKSGWIERDLARGLVSDLLEQREDPSAFLRKRTTHRKGRPLLAGGRSKVLPITAREEADLRGFCDRLDLAAQARGRFLYCDAARRIAGTGSLGLPRYVIVVAGDGSKWGHRLLDLKAAAASSLLPRAGAQPEWPDEATRVVSLQRRFQAVTQALLHPVRFRDSDWILRELQPSEDRLRLELAGGRLKPLRRVVATYGQLAAWGHLRGSGRDGAAPAEALIDFARSDWWRRPLLEYARAYVEQVRRDWRAFARWWAEKGQEKR